MPKEKRRAVKITIFPKWCKKCGICAAFCPRGVFKFKEGELPEIAHPERCIACQLCVLLCPDMAIMLECEDEKAKTVSSAGE